MTTEEVRKTIALLLKQGQIICDIVKPAAKSKKSLSGDNFYGLKFQRALISLTQIETKLIRVLYRFHIEDPCLSQLQSNISTLKSSNTKPRQKIAALKELQLICGSRILPEVEASTADPTPETEQILPLSVVSGTRRGHLEKVITQANGCYEHQWFDACSVMIRRFVETLIIEVYEGRGKADEVKDSNGDFLMLRDLVSKLLSDTSWNLSRQTKKALPLIKDLGDLSAHNRRYLAKKPDIEKVLPGLRILADDLLHLAGLK